MDMWRGRIVAGGRVQVPADARRLLGLSDGDPVVMRVIDGQLHIRPVKDALTRIQDKLREYVPHDAPHPEKLTAKHRVEAEAEDE